MMPLEFLAFIVLFAMVARCLLQKCVQWQGNQQVEQQPPNEQGQQVNEYRVRNWHRDEHRDLWIASEGIQQISGQNEPPEAINLDDRIRATENALIVKQVIADCESHGPTEHLVVGNPTPGNPKLEADELEEEDSYQEKSSCVICLQTFRVGDVVAWSRRGVNCEENVGMENNCHHVFHRDCIESWLINSGHDNCPSCRTRLLEFEPLCSDNIEFGLHKEHGEVNFVIKNGLVSRLQPASLHNDGETMQVACPLRDTSDNPIPCPQFSQLISLSDLRSISQTRLHSGSSGNQVPRSNRRIRSVTAFGRLMLSTNRNNDAFSQTPRTPRSSRNASLERQPSLSLVGENRPRRRQCQNRSMSELPWKMYNKRHRSLQPETSPEFFRRSGEQLMCPLAGDSIPDRQGSRQLPTSSCRL